MFLPVPSHTMYGQISLHLRGSENHTARARQISIFSGASSKPISQCKINIAFKWAAPCANVSSGICGQGRPSSACASAQSDQGLPCPLTESLDTVECINGEQMTELYFAHAHDDLNLRILHMFEGTFSA